MKFTLMLDLDDTLLNSNMQEFAPAYFSSLSAALAEDVSPDIMIPALVSGTSAMMHNEDPAFTLREVFNNQFFPRLNIRREALQAKIDQFYDDEFPKLEGVTSQRPEAIEFVKWAFSSGHQVAVATNPLFPRKAILHRLRWAGLAPEKYPFALISSYETFHFAKEIPAYFPEFLAQMGWPEGPVVMVGNDLDMDLLPAMNAGIPVYWLKEIPDSLHAEIPQGDFSHLRQLLDSADNDSLLPVLSSTNAIVNLLRSTPAALGTLTSTLAEEDWSRTRIAGEWSPTEIFCHLRDVEAEINVPRLRGILAENNLFLPGIVSDKWALERQYSKQDGKQALAAFFQSRSDLLRILTDEQMAWDRQVRHAIFGPTTLVELTKFMAEHDRLHIQQFWRSLHAGN